MTYTANLLRDPRVLEMADRNHVPEEFTIRNGVGLPVCQVKCSQCGEDWPCAIRHAVNAMKETLLKETLDSFDLKTWSGPAPPQTQPETPTWPACAVTPTHPNPSRAWASSPSLPSRSSSAAPPAASPSCGGA